MIIILELGLKMNFLQFSGWLVRRKRISSPNRENGGIQGQGLRREERRNWGTAETEIYHQPKIQNQGQKTWIAGQEVTLELASRGVTQKTSVASQGVVQRTGVASRGVIQRTGVTGQGVARKTDVASQGVTQMTGNASQGVALGKGVVGPEVSQETGDCKIRFYSKY